MKIILDTANLNEVKVGYSWGILDGVNTNPSLVDKEGKDMTETILEIANLGVKSVSAEVISTVANEMIEELQRSFNKARKTSITRDLLDIVGGAEALRG